MNNIKGFFGLLIIGVVFHVVNTIGVIGIIICVVIVVSIYYFYTKENSKVPIKTKNKRTQSYVIEIETIHTQNKDSDYPYGTPIELIQAYESAKYDHLRAMLQKIAYGMVGDDVSQAEKDEFKKIMTYFASRDPLYAKLVKKLIAIISKQEGIVQSKIYVYLPDYSTEILRYVLYFAHELEDVYRVKKGRSYNLYTSIEVYSNYLPMQTDNKNIFPSKM